MELMKVEINGHVFHVNMTVINIYAVYVRKLAAQ